MTEVTTQQNVEDGIATPSPTPSSEAYDFIGEGKQYANADVALKSIPHKDQHIATIEAENAELREKLAKAGAIEDVLSAIKSGGNEMNPNNESDSDPNAGLKEAIQEVLQQEKAQAVAESNRAEVNSALTDMFGDGAADAVKARADELGMTVEQINIMAASSPKACLALFSKPTTNADQDKDRAHSHQTNVNTQAQEENPAVDSGTKAYYDNLRRTNPQAYMSSAVQNQMMKDAQANPEKFFGSRS